MSFNFSTLQCCCTGRFVNKRHVEIAGLSALSPPLPAHTLQGSRIGVGTLPAMNYPPTLPVGMGLESLSAVNSLGTSFTTQSPYTKSVPQPAFSLDGSSHADMAR